jgi:5'-nucleotidase
MLRAPLIAALALTLTACATAPAPSPTVELQVLALNDFHGNLEPPRGGIAILNAAGESVRVPGGGAARLATLVAERRATAQYSIMVAAGDLIGASPMLSSLFHDEPAIESMNMMGLALTSVGNHEFDEGPAELLRMQNGGCHPTDGCRGPAPFQGARFRYLAASTIVSETGQTLFPASDVRTFDGVRVGFIGLALEGTPELVSPLSVAGLTFRDEIETINAEAARLQADGVQAIVVMIHEGGYQQVGAGACPGVSGPIVDIVNGLSAAVDVVVSGHTNGIYICEINGKLLTSASWSTAMLTDIRVTLDRATGDVTHAQAQNFVTVETVAADPAQAAHIAAYSALAAPLRNRPVGELAAPVPNTYNAAGENPMGFLIADSMIAATQTAFGQPADIALMNPGGIRADLPRAGALTLADLFTVQPFGNELVQMEMTGAEIEAVLAQQFRGERPTILQPSDGLRYTWRQPASGGEIVPGSIRIGGARLNRTRTYRVVTNGFVAAGGDGFSAFQAGRNRVVFGNDLDTLEVYAGAHRPLSAPPLGRLRVQ